MNLTTTAGQPNPSADSAKASDAHISAINQVFALFRVNYHNQYYKAFPDQDTLAIAKKLWLSSTRGIEPDTLLSAAERLIKTHTFLPTVSAMLEACYFKDRLPDAHLAYLEACNATHPKSKFPWSHPLVFHAGEACGWYYLANADERAGFTVFRNHYQTLKEKWMLGEVFRIPQVEEITQQTPAPVSRAEGKKNAQQLLSTLFPEDSGNT